MNAFILLNIKTVLLYLSYIKIVTIHPKAFWTSESNNTTTHTEFKSLYLNDNNIKYIKSGTFDPLINLEELYLYANMINYIDNTFIVKLYKLTHFNIADNELTQLPTKWLPNSLQQLGIRGNAIKVVSSKTFEDARNLHMIWLSLTNLTI